MKTVTIRNNEVRETKSLALYSRELWIYNFIRIMLVILACYSFFRKKEKKSPLTRTLKKKKKVFSLIQLQAQLAFF